MLLVSVGFVSWRNLRAETPRSIRHIQFISDLMALRGICGQMVQPISGRNNETNSQCLI